jgi:hypothetical protein
LVNVAGSILIIINSFFMAPIRLSASISHGSLSVSPLYFGNNIAVEKTVSDIAPRQRSALYIDEQEASS